MKIEIKDLSCRIGNKTILNRVNMTFGENRLIGIIGPNGCGKTTLLKHIYREIPSKNCVFLDEKDVAAYNSREFARKVAVMSQHSAQADDGLSVSEIVRMGRYPYKGILEEYNEDDDRMVDEALEATGLIDFRNRKLRTMSGGEIQRAMIARCFVQQPQVIILDEPTNHLDVKYKLELMKLLKQFKGLVIMTIHDLNLASVYCDSLYVMKSGEVAGHGKPEEVLTEQLLEEVFEVKFNIIKDNGKLLLNI